MNRALADAFFGPAVSQVTKTGPAPSAPTAQDVFSYPPPPAYSATATSTLVEDEAELKTAKVTAKKSKKKHKKSVQ